MMTFLWQLIELQFLLRIKSNHHRRSWHGPPPFFSKFLFANLFSKTIWESLSFHLITWLPVFNVPQFIAKLVIPPNYRLHRRWQFNEGALYMIWCGRGIDLASVSMIYLVRFWNRSCGAVFFCLSHLVTSTF
jgi:hypothetical protein